MRTRRISKQDKGNERGNLQEPLADSVIVEKVKAPGWLLSRYPTLKRKMPKCIVGRLNTSILSWSHPERCHWLSKSEIELQRRVIDGDREKFGRREILEEIAITGCMNNFVYQLYCLSKLDEARLKEKVGDRSPYISEKLRNSTYGEFLEDIKRAIKECGLSFERLLELASKHSGGYVYRGDTVVEEYPRKEATLSSFPAFVRLVEMGYNIPDLAA